MAHVLIGFAEALSAPETVFSLRRAGHRVSAFARRGRLPLSRLVEGRIAVLPAPETDHAAATAALRALMEGPGAPDIVLPLDDIALWLADRAFGDDARIAGARGARVRPALDKTVQIEAARAAGLSVPATVVVRAPGDLDGLPPLPAIAKPALAAAPEGQGHERGHGRGLGRGTARYLMDDADVARLSADLDAGSVDAPLLIQPLVHGQGRGVFGFATETGVVGWSGHLRLRMMNPHGSGSSACRAAPPEPALRETVSAFLADLGWRGPFMMEFLRDAAGTDWFMELNGRLWGSLALARRQGMEYPAWSVAEALEPGFVPEVPPPATGAPVEVRHLGRDLVHLAFVLKGPKSAFHREAWPGFARSLAGVVRPAGGRAFYNYDPDFPSFFLRDAAATVAGQMRR